jgi:hypothetical protein
MDAIVGGTGLLFVIGAVVARQRRRRRDDPLFRRSQALAVLGQIADNPRRLSHERRPVDPPAYVRIVERDDDSTVPRLTHRPMPTARDVSVFGRPTIAVLPHPPERAADAASAPVR